MGELTEKITGLVKGGDEKPQMGGISASGGVAGSASFLGGKRRRRRSSRRKSRKSKRKSKKSRKSRRSRRR